MLLIDKELPHMQLKELRNASKLVWIKIFANRTSHCIASWHREPSGSCEDFQLFRNQLDCIKSHSRGCKLPSVRVLGDFNFRDILWPDGLNNNKTMLNQSEGQVLIDIMNDLVWNSWFIFQLGKKIHLIWISYPVSFRTYTRRLNSVILILLQAPLTFSSLPRKKKKKRRKVYLFQNADYNSMWKEAFNFDHEKYFNGHSNPRSVQENFDLVTSFIQQICKLSSLDHTWDKDADPKKIHKSLYETKENWRKLGCKLVLKN